MMRRGTCTRTRTRRCPPAPQSAACLPHRLPSVWAAAPGLRSRFQTLEAVGAAHMRRRLVRRRCHTAALPLIALRPIGAAAGIPREQSNAATAAVSPGHARSSASTQRRDSGNDYLRALASRVGLGGSQTCRGRGLPPLRRSLATQLTGMTVATCAAARAAAGKRCDDGSFRGRV